MIPSDSEQLSKKVAAKPEWFLTKVNRAGEVPVIAYGGPVTPPDDPSPESAKFGESLVLLEFIADLYPNSTIRPADVVERTKARLFIDAVYLIPEKTYAINDDFTLADIAILPLLASMEIWLKNDIGAFPAGEGIKGAAYFLKGARFKRMLEYLETMKKRETRDLEARKQHIADRGYGGKRRRRPPR
ncbi:hypothetical protein FB45DRAFT_985344 [Roridomyces roridus]|uniref:Glutathione S-transferase n=1 Tax=Roridomyces roridus TaxID=1738132 RepID=A0AAD7F5D7_9AGAR|nr:hypothetical protein FB45DRAFT_985344 [Roridomyces roridus]